MKRNRIKSSLIYSIGFDAASKVLEVEFKGGLIQRCLAVPASIYKDLYTSHDPDEFFRNFIDGKFEYDTRKKSRKEYMLQLKR